MITGPSSTIYLLGATALFSLGLFGLIAAREMIRRVLAVNIMGTAVFLIFITIATRTPGDVADPIPQAMVLTGIVVTVCGTGLALSLIKRLMDLEELTGGEDVTDP